MTSLRWCAFEANRQTLSGNPVNCFECFDVEIFYIEIKQIMVMMLFLTSACFRKSAFTHNG